jgi:hypothetical protein
MDSSVFESSLRILFEAFAENDKAKRIFPAAESAPTI